MKNGESTATSKPSLLSQIEELSTPRPQSLTLTAILQLLEPLEETQPDVFLMTRSYVQNWLIWAYHQKVTKTESGRVEEGARLAAERLRLTTPHTNMPYENPGPIDASILSLEGHPLLLRPNVTVRDNISDSQVRVPSILRRVKSLPEEVDKKNERGQGIEFNSLDFDGDQVLCCAVPQQFYETLRSVHGVVCTDGFTIAFQPVVEATNTLLHHHYHGSAPKSQATPDQRNNVPQPIEFRRRVMMKPLPKVEFSAEMAENASPMTKLLLEQESLQQPRMIPWVEVYPIKLNYSIVDDQDTEPNSLGFVLISRRSQVYKALQSLLKVAAPQTVSSCRRVWTKRPNPGTKNAGDGHELIELDGLDGKLLRKDQDSDLPTPQISVEAWLDSFGDTEAIKELDVLVEIRKSTGAWPRESLELGNRLQVGDFVDAQDSAGKWYEAVVRNLHDDFVNIHYFGWASKWDATIRRRPGVHLEGACARIRNPCPLWTHSPRWRETITEGKLVEVRDTSSRADRPKWYKGVVRRVGTMDGKPEIIVGGAELELYDDPSGKLDEDGKILKKPLLLLQRTKQILVEIEQEKHSSPAMGIASIPNSKTNDDSLTPEPPFLRWINLYGEEVCQAGTHMTIEPDGDLGVVTLRYEYDSGRKPVEVMKSWNNMYGQGLMKESLVGTPPAPGSVGMHNLGNSCFLNSIVQCLNHIEPLTQFFLKGDYQRDMNRQNPLGSGGRVATAYAALLKEIWSGKYAALAPRMLKQTVASFAPQFNNSYQHDSQEFCQFLMDGIHEDCNRVKSKPYVEELEGFGMEDERAAIETWRKHLLRHDSVIVDHFQGMHRSHLTCPSCGRESIKFDVYSTISVPLAEDKNGLSAVKLEDCIEKFMEGEQLDEINAWYCPGCKKHVCALKMIALWSVPDVLILHMKRFQFDHCSVRNDIVRSKIDATVKFPIDCLDLRRHVLGPFDESAPPVYKLYGVSEHMGPTANSGHYTATARNSKDGRWYRYNDAHVGETTGDAAVTGGAYLLFYQRVKGTARWGGMEKLMQDRGIDPFGGSQTDLDGFKTVKSTKKKKN